jgi:hypothetical protein
VSSTNNTDLHDITEVLLNTINPNHTRGRSSGGEGALKKIAPSGGRHENIGVFRVKNHNFTPKNHIFSNFRRGMRWVRPTPLDLPLHTKYIYLPSDDSCLRSESLDLILLRNLFIVCCMLTELTDTSATFELLLLRNCNPDNH